MGNPSAHTQTSPYRFSSAGAGGHKGRPYIAAARSTGAAHILPVRKKRGPVPVRHTPAGSPAAARNTASTSARSAWPSCTFTPST